MDDNPLPVVVPYSMRYAKETAWLPGDAPAPPPFTGRCEACSAKVDMVRLHSFIDDAVEHFVCLDTAACMARVRGDKETPGTRSFLMDAVNRLTARVEVLERAALGNVGAGDAADVLVGASAAAEHLEQVAAIKATMKADDVAHAYIAYQTAHPQATHTIARADARAIPMDDNTVDLIVTSPPYWAQRSYIDNGEHYEAQLGAETFYGDYLDTLIECTREFMRVLKPTGSIWINLGDKYSGGGEVQAKSLIGLPWRYALRCIDELGLILRAEVIWSKPNGLPEPHADRVRRSHEQWFHFTLQRSYYSGVGAIRETIKSDRAVIRLGSAEGRIPGSVREIPTQPLNVPPELGLNHFAAFPMEWPRWIVQGWSPERVCNTCQEGRTPVLGVGVCACTPYVDHPASDESSGPGYAAALADGAYPPHALGLRPKTGPWREYIPDGWVPPDSTPGVVVDPFGGTGTVALVAEMHGRHGVSLDLSADYNKIAAWRVNDPVQRASALQVPKPPVQLSGQMDMMDLMDGEW